MRTLLSVDFDFFIKENPIWDFGHNETNEIFMHAAWLARYLSIDLYKETDIRRYADFAPDALISKLRWLGFKLEKPSVIIADSHKFAFDVVKSMRDCRIFNFDAHHDCWMDMSEINCANWLSRSILAKYALKSALWIAPSWLREFDNDFSKSLGINAKYFSYLKKNEFKGIKIDAIFLCRSGC